MTTKKQQPLPTRPRHELPLLATMPNVWSNAHAEARLDGLHIRFFYLIHKDAEAPWTEVASPNDLARCADRLFRVTEGLR